jgi:hypothetical protein
MSATPSREAPLTGIIAESLAPSAVLLTLGFVAVGFPIDIDAEVWVEAKFNNAGVSVAETATIVATAPTGFEVVFQSVKLNVPHPASRLLVPHTELLFIEPINI